MDMLPAGVMWNARVPFRSRIQPDKPNGYLDQRFTPENRDSCSVKYAYAASLFTFTALGPGWHPHRLSRRHWQDGQTSSSLMATTAQLIPSRTSLEFLEYQSSSRSCQQAEAPCNHSSEAIRLRFVYHELGHDCLLPRGI